MGFSNTRPRTNTGSLTKYGSDIITNGAFAADSDWTKGTGWTISGGNASCDGSQLATSYMYQDGSGIVAGRTYKTVFTLSGRSAGEVLISAGGGGWGSWRSSDDTYTEEIVASGADRVNIGANTDFVGDVDDVTVQLKTLS